MNEWGAAIGLALVLLLLYRINDSVREIAQELARLKVEVKTAAYPADHFGAGDSYQFRMLAELEKIAAKATEDDGRYRS
jgi:hypothetical protein